MRRAWAAGVVAMACHAASAPVERVGPPAHLSAPAAVSPFPEVSPFRLPHTFEPKRYRVRLAIGERRFTGHVEIDGELSESVALIWLHGVDLVVSRARAIGADGREVPLAFSPPRPDQVLGLYAEHLLPAGTWTLAIDYDAPIRELEPQIANPDQPGTKIDRVATGVFRRGRYVYTQGEAIYARAIVPCIDEPDRKVPWQLALDVASTDLAASTSPIVRETPLAGGKKRVEFAETRPLPSYLLAFAVGPFDIVDAGKAKSGVPIRILVRQGHADNAAWAAPELRRILDFLEDYLAVPYPYGKLDVVAVPHLGVGAMENPGLVTVNEPLLEQLHYRPVLSHELAHQWFGDLVTMAWWDDVWLAESLADWLAAKVENHLDGGGDDRVTLREAGLWYSPNGIRRPADTPEALDVSKLAPVGELMNGAWLIDLVESHVGMATFREAVHAYLVFHADRSATTADLEDAIASTAHQPVPLAEMLRQPPGSVGATVICVDTGGRLAVTLPWPTQVCAAYDRDGARAQVCELLGPKDDALLLPAKRCPTWAMPNPDGTGLYKAEWPVESMVRMTSSAWPRLHRDERRLVFFEQRDPLMRLSIYRGLAANDLSVNERADYLGMLAHYVPDDVTAAFAAMVDHELGASFRAFHFTAPSKIGDDAIAALAVAIHDPAVAREATELAAHLDRLPTDFRWRVEVLALAASSDDALRDKLIEQLARTDSSAYEAATVLIQVPSFWPTIARDPSRLDRVATTLLFVLSQSCTSEAATQLRVYGKRHPAGSGFADRVDRCVRIRDQDEFGLRSWLAPPKPSVP